MVTEVNEELQITVPVMLTGLPFPLVRCVSKDNHPGLVSDMFRWDDRGMYSCMYCPRVLTIELLADRYPDLKWWAGNV